MRRSYPLEGTIPGLMPTAQPRPAQHRPGSHMPLAALLIIAASLPAQDPRKDPDQIGSRNVARGPNFYSIEKELALGKALAQAYERDAPIVLDEKVAEYVNRLGQNLARNSDAKLPLVTKVVRDETINALSLPGGHLYVNTGLILAAETEAELAGAMAHEIAHVAARHGTRGATRSQIWNLASMSLVFVGGPIGFAAREVTSIAMPMTFMKFSRGFEREADLLGIEYEYAAGYDPEAFIDFFERISV